MNLPAPAVDIRGFRLSKLNTPEYRHLWLMLIWPSYILCYILLSIFVQNVDPHIIYCSLDDLIPFIEWFVIFYVLWYVFIFGMHLYLAFFDVKIYKRYTIFLICTLGVSTLIYIIYPSCQELRPTSFEKSNIFTWIIGLIYSVDNNCNVFPSEHVIGALAVVFAGAHTKTLSRPAKIIIAVLGIMIALSTVFIKQHSVLDIFSSTALCAVAYIPIYLIPKQKTLRRN